MTVTMKDEISILSAIEQGDAHAAEQLLPLVYDQLRKLAAVRLAREKPGQTLDATALVHEAYARLVDQHRVQRWDGSGHFFAAAAEAMRRILVENARRKSSRKAGNRGRNGARPTSSKTCSWQGPSSGMIYLRLTRRSPSSRRRTPSRHDSSSFAILPG